MELGLLRIICNSLSFRLVFILIIGIIASLNFWELKSLVREALINHECFSLLGKDFSQLVATQSLQQLSQISQIVDAGGWF